GPPLVEGHRVAAAKMAVARFKSPHLRVAGRSPGAVLPAPAGQRGSANCHRGTRRRVRPGWPTPGPASHLGPTSLAAGAMGWSSRWHSAASVAWTSPAGALRRAGPAPRPSRRRGDDQVLHVLLSS